MSDTTRKLDTNGPFGTTVRRTEYAIVVNGVIMDPPAFRSKEDARAFVLQWRESCDDDAQPEIHIVHRAVTEDPWYTTTP